jgi:hypothetical protein
MTPPRHFPETVPQPDHAVSCEARERLYALSPLGPHTHAASIAYDGTREGHIRSVMRLLDAAPPDVISVSFLWGDELVVVPRFIHQK